MATFGLLGRTLKHSFSKRYFTEKFAREGLAQHRYELFELAEIADFLPLLRKYPDLAGLNVTIPYKEAILPFLDALDDTAAAVGAVNCVVFRGGQCIGYNTDVLGFQQSLQEAAANHLQSEAKALILGNGGAAKAVEYVLNRLKTEYRILARQPRGEKQYPFESCDTFLLKNHLILIQTTPLGMYPDIHSLPPLPYAALTEQHFLFDLVYNPEITAFLQQGILRGSATLNGLPMLYAQADAAWKLWNASQL